jgi:hypothetical protein
MAVYLKASRHIMSKEEPKMQGKEKEERTTHKLLALWAGRKQDWLTYKEIVKGLRGFGIGDRTVDRYLATLVRDGKLSKEERGYKKTFYTPRNEFLQELSQSRDWLRIYEESLSRIGEYVMGMTETAVIDSKETTEKIRDEIDNLSEYERDSDERIMKAVSKILSKQTLTKKERKMLNSLLDRLFDTIYRCLSNPYVHGRIADPDEVASTVDDDVRSVVSAYMNAWKFIYEHPGGLLRVREKYAKGASSRRS